MDDVDPSPAELEATAVLTREPGAVRIEVAQVEPRFVAAPYLGPRVFRDLFEADLLLETPPDGLQTLTELVFGGVTLTGTATVLATGATTPQEGAAGSVVVPIDPPTPPGEVSSSSGAPLVLSQDGRSLSWDDETDVTSQC